MKYKGKVDGYYLVNYLADKRKNFIKYKLKCKNFNGFYI